MVWSGVLLMAGLYSGHILGFPAYVSLLHPRLSIHPDHPVYIMQETVKMTCSIPEGNKDAYFTFHKNSKWITDGLSPTYYIRSLDDTFVGIYTCEYWNGRSNSPKSNQIIIKIQDPPPSPIISVDSLHPVYIRGETVILTCNPPIHPVKRITFYKAQQEFTERKTNGNETIFVISTNDPGAAGKYFCGYCMEIHGRGIQSYSSHAVEIKIIEPPAAPSITLSPSQAVYIKGEDVTLTCTTPGDLAENIIIYKEQQNIKNKKASGIESKLVISTSAQGTAGNYRCAYLVEIYGRVIQSYPSGTEIIRITEPPAAPNITRSPVQSLYIKGENVTLTCTTPGDLVKNILFYKEQQSIKEEKTNRAESNHVISTSVQEAAGNYSCAYLVEIYGRNILSYQSATEIIRITDQTTTIFTPISTTMEEFQSNKDYLPYWIYYATGGGVCFVLFSLVLVLLLCKTHVSRKRKKPDTMPAPLTSTQSLESQRMVSPPVTVLTDLKEMENEHQYSEIGPPAQQVKTSICSLRPVNSKAFSGQRLNNCDFIYSTTQAFDALPPIYIAELPNKCAKKKQSPVSLYSTLGTPL